ncbi:MAG: glycosyltransferase family 4 protein [Candidatus Levybacteria bacterium]|nr:glycosyltransferase family 4 protein [Candidatus Levybacteria bacterium]
MNVLFITYDFPYPMTSGGKNRAYHLLKYTAKKANVFLYSFVREDYNPELNDEILKLGVKNIKVYKRKKLASPLNIPSTIIHNSSIFKTLYFEKAVIEELRDIIHNEKIDIVHYESTYTGYYIDALRTTRVKSVLGTENIEYLLYYDYAKYMKRFYLKPFVKQQAARLKEEELLMAKRADSVTVITNDEADLLEREIGIKSEIVANGIEPDNFTFSYDPKIKKNILFVGNFTYFPNVDAVNYFYSNVFKKLKKDLTFTIIGKQSGAKFKFEDEKVITKDFVEDIISEYRSADILIFPIRIGGGTNFKVLEAMSLGLPIVAQPERLSGLGAIAGEHFLKAGSPDEYIEQINLIYNDGTLRKRLAVNARALVEKSYKWEKIGNDLLNVWRKMI